MPAAVPPGASASRFRFDAFLLRSRPLAAAPASRTPRGVRHAPTPPVDATESSDAPARSRRGRRCAPSLATRPPPGSRRASRRSRRSIDRRAIVRLGRSGTIAPPTRRHPGRRVYAPVASRRAGSPDPDPRHDARSCASRVSRRDAFARRAAPGPGRPGRAPTLKPWTARAIAPRGPGPRRAPAPFLAPAAHRVLSRAPEKHPPSRVSPQTTPPPPPPHPPPPTDRAAAAEFSTPVGEQPPPLHSTTLSFKFLPFATELRWRRRLARPPPRRRPRPPLGGRRRAPGAPAPRRRAPAAAAGPGPGPGRVRRRREFRAAVLPRPLPHARAPPPLLQRKQHDGGGDG